MDSPFSALTHEELAPYLQSHGCPLFLFDEAALLARFHEIKAALHRQSARAVIAYSYKTNPLSGLISLLHGEGAYAEVVSDHEYELARALGVPGPQIVFNGPAKSDETLARAVTEGAVINVDHFEELQRLERIAATRRQPVDIGLRLVPSATGATWTRFGFDWGNGAFGEALSFCHHSPWLSVRGLHAHIGTNIRDLERFRQLGRVMAEAAKLLTATTGQPPQWIDFGGGLAGVSPSHEEAALTLHPPFDPRPYAEAVIAPVQRVAPEATLFFEPGRTLVDHCGALVTQVIGVRHRDGQKAAYILDSGINVVPTLRAYRHPIRPLPRRRDEDLGDYSCGRAWLSSTLLGSSCMNHDVIARDLALPPLQRGDLLLISAVGAYNVSRGVSFIHRKPGALLWHGAGKTATTLRNPEGFWDYIGAEPLPASHTQARDAKDPVLQPIQG